MKVVVMSKTSFDVAEYSGVTSISKASNTVTISYGTSSTVTVNTLTHIVRIVES